MIYEPTTVEEFKGLPWDMLMAAVQSGNENAKKAAQELNAELFEELEKRDDA